MISERSERALTELLRVEKQRAQDRWNQVDTEQRNGRLAKADEARYAAMWHERTINLIRAAVPELPQF